MLVVSSINLTKNVQTVKPSSFLQSTSKGFTVNVSNDYRYLKTGYYVSMHAEILGNNVIPSSRNIIDANRTPILLLKARKAGIPTLPNLTTGSIKQILSETKFPIVVFPVNPFMYDGFKIARNKSGLYRAVKSLGMNYKFAVCVQPLMDGIVSFKSIFGKCELNEFKEISRKVYEVFKIPLCKLHVQHADDQVFLCGLQSLKKEEISSHDLEVISQEICSISETVGNVG